MHPSLSVLTKSAPRQANLLRKKARTPPLSLEHFIQRQRTLALWRTIVRSIYRIPKENRRDPLSYVKGEFERHKNVKDITQIRYLISTGKTEFEKMERYIDELAAR